MKGKSKEEKLEIVLRNIRNIKNVNLEKKEITMICPVCGEIFTQGIVDLYKRFSQRMISKEDEEYYSIPCLNRTCVGRYGNNKSAIEKQKQTNIKKYGVESSFCLNRVKEASKKARIKKYGSISNQIKKNWENYEKKTGCSHNMRNPDSLKKNQLARSETIGRMSKERKLQWKNKSFETMQEKETLLFGYLKVKSSNFFEIDYDKRAEILNPFGRYSKQQIDFFNLLTEKTDFNIMFGDNEKVVFYEDRFFLLDGYIEDLKIAIEYNGDFWHANPKLYSRKDVLSFPGGGVIAEDIWIKDRRKKEGVEKKLGCEVMYVWEKDFVENPEATVEKVVEKIREIKNG